MLLGDAPSTPPCSILVAELAAQYTEQLVGAGIAALQVPSRPTAAVPVDNPYCSCKLTRVLRSRCSLTSGQGRRSPRPTSRRRTSSWVSDAPPTAADMGPCTSMALITSGWG